MSALSLVSVLFFCWHQDGHSASEQFSTVGTNQCLSGKWLINRQVKVIGFFMDSDKRAESGRELPVVGPARYM